MIRKNGRGGGTQSDTSELLRFFSGKIEQYPILTREEEVELFKRIEAGDVQAREDLVYSNVRIVIKTAFVYWNISRKRYGPIHFALDDLVQVGFTGLYRAVEKFDWRRGNKFSTYVSWWIRQAISRLICNTGNTIRLPVNLQARISKYRKTVIRLTKELGRTPHLVEIAGRMKLRVDCVEELIAITQIQPMSLDEPSSPESPDSTLLSVIPTKGVQPWRDVHRQNILAFKQEKIERVLKSLTSQERDVITLRFGLDGQGERTLGEVGKLYGVTRERIRQIEGKALLKLRERHEEDLAELLFEMGDK
ncbi:MAG: sigma-70 family RNA polymerase sigma factor [Candidatus Paceibacterota bacterium]